MKIITVVLLIFFAVSPAYSQDSFSNCCLGCVLGGTFFLTKTAELISIISPAIPDYHFMIYETGSIHGMGFKLPLGFTFLDSSYNANPGFYLLNPKYIMGGKYKGMESINSFRLEIMGELILTSGPPGILYGGSARLYMPAGPNLSFHVEGGLLFASKLVLPHAGGGIGLYFNDVYYSSGEKVEKTIVSIVLQERLLFDTAGQLMNDISLDVKFWLSF